MGNLVSRITTPKLIARLPSPAALYTAPDVVDPADEELLQELKDLPSAYRCCCHLPRQVSMTDMLSR
jgi:hypothetical protein